jgi:uncharacterized protein YggU (UPF0235/DUF167 family)
MVKAITTIYLQSGILEEAKARKLEISRICEEALKLSLNHEANSGKVEGALGNFLTHQAEKKKDIDIIKRLSRKRDEKFSHALRVYCAKYNIELSEAVKEIGL